MMEIEIGMELLTPHPENCNYMNTETIEKLKRHIARTGNYEPLTVRPHPDGFGKFQVINGHHRLKVLRQLGYKSIKCTVWNIDDNQARLYLATLNRLTGKDVQERRALLMENLLGTFDTHELAELLPDPIKQIEQISMTTDENNEILDCFKQNIETTIDAKVMLTFMLTESDSDTINEALDSIISDSGNQLRNKALVTLASFYLQQQPRLMIRNKPSGGIGKENGR